MAGLAHTSTIPCKSVLHPTHLEPLRKMTHDLEEAPIRLPDAQDWEMLSPSAVSLLGMSILDVVPWFFFHLPGMLFCDGIERNEWLCCLRFRKNAAISRF